MAPNPETTTAPTKPDETTLKYQGILKSNGITDEVSEVIVKHADLQGEGMASQSSYVTIKFQDSNKEPLELFVKGQTSNPSHTQMLDEFKAFEKEARFFREYVPAAKALCEAKGLKGLVDFYPTCYYADEKAIVLENLLLKGYTLIDKREMQDLEAARFALNTLAKHHAVSYALIEEEGGSEKFFKRFPDLDHESFDTPYFLEGMMDPMVGNALRNNLTLLEKNVVDGQENAVIKLKSMVPNAKKNIMDTLKSDGEKLLLLDHGDYWNNNMMFQKDANGRITGHKAIDLQITRYNSPGIDLSYYFFLSVKPEIRRKYLYYMLGIYLDIFNQTCSQLGHPVNLSYEELVMIFRRKFKLGYWFGFCFTIGPGLSAFKEVDLNKLEDISDFATIIDKVIQKWIDDHPEEGQKTAEEIVKLVNEFWDLKLD